jgi:hypothetical protein
MVTIGRGARSLGRGYVPTLRTMLAIALASSCSITIARAQGNPERRTNPTPPPGRSATPQALNKRVPDLSGVWNGGGLTLERGYDGNMGTGYYEDFFDGTNLGRPKSPSTAAPPKLPDDAFLIGTGPDTEDRRIPFLPWARERKEANYKAIYRPSGQLSLMEVDPVARCLPTGVPRAQYIGIGGYHILQTDKTVAIFGEWNHQFRSIALDGRPPLNESIALWTGSSRGQWNGDTLVVDTKNLTGETWLDHMGSVHSAKLTVRETYRLRDANTLEYKATLSDPGAFTKPWSVTVLLKRGQPGEELLEYACAEGNKSIANYTAQK